MSSHYKTNYLWRAVQGHYAYTLLSASDVACGHIFA